MSGDDTENSMNWVLRRIIPPMEWFLYQYGGAYYREDGTARRLGSEAAVQVFAQWFGNYADYI